MTLLQAFRTYGWLSAAIALVTISAVFLLERGGTASFSAAGSIMIARPEVDPSRAASREVNLTGAIADTSTADAREAFAADGGRDDYRIIQVSESRAQVLASGEGAVPGVRAVLRSLADHVAGQQLAAQIEAEERIRPRLFLQIPVDDLAALGAIEGSVSGELPEVVGTFVLEDPLAGAENPLGGTAAATRLVLLRVNSDDGTQELLEELPRGASFGINAFDRQARELLTVTTNAASPADALQAFDTVTAAVEAELARRQELAEVPSDARLLVDVIAAPINAVEADEGLSGRALVLLVLGLGGALAAPTILRELSLDRSTKWPTRAGSVGDTARDEQPDQPSPGPVRSGAPSP